MTGPCVTCGGRHPMARVSRRVDGGRLAVTCPVCRSGSVVEFLGTRPLPGCGHTVEIVNRAAAATRTRRARQRSQCPSCLKSVLPGQRITEIPTRGWVHVGCIPAVAAVRPSRADVFDDRPPSPVAHVSAVVETQPVTQEAEADGTR